MRDRATVFLNSLLPRGPLRLLEVGIHEAWTAKRLVTSFLVDRPGSQYFGNDIWIWGDTPIPDSKKLAILNLKEVGVEQWPTCGPNGWWFDGDIFQLVSDIAIARGSLDIAYIDASHKPAPTLLESCLCFELLKPGGFLLWDDYDARNPVTQEVRQAVDPFLKIYGPKLDVIDAEYQLLARKLA